MPLNQIMDKENVVHLYNGILLSDKKQWHLEICRQMDGTIKKTIMSEVTKTKKDKNGMYLLTSGY